MASTMEFVDFVTERFDEDCGVTHRGSARGWGVAERAGTDHDPRAAGAESEEAEEEELNAPSLLG